MHAACRSLARLSLRPALSCERRAATTCQARLLSTTRSTQNTAATAPPLTSGSTQSTTTTTSSLAAGIAALRSQPRHWAKVKINGFAYIVTAGDVVYLPYRLQDVSVGQELRLGQVTQFGSRDYTASGATPADGIARGVCDVTATVVEFTKEPLRLTIYKKRRQRSMRVAKSKLPYTVLRISKVAVAPAQSEL